MTTMSDRIRAHPELPSSEVARVVGVRRERVSEVRSRDIHQAGNRAWRAAVAQRWAAIDKQIVVRRAKKQSYSVIAKALGLANRNVVAGRITRMRAAGVVVP